MALTTIDKLLAVDFVVFVLGLIYHESPNIHNAKWMSSTEQQRKSLTV